MAAAHRTVGRQLPDGRARPRREDALRENFFSPTATRQRHIGNSPEPARYDSSFQGEEAKAYRRDVPDAAVHVIDAGHFALDEAPDVVADLTRKFLDTTVNGATKPG